MASVFLFGAPPAVVVTGPFLGNPNATAITSISGSIVCSRTSGTTPFFVQVSASGVTAVGTTNPYEDLEYNWDFGDPSGIETFTRPTDGATVNANNGQIAPEAAYVYRTAGTGTKTITLTIRGKNGADFTTTTLTRTISLTTFVADTGCTWYYDSNSPAGGSGDGSTPALAYNSLTSLFGNLNSYRAKKIQIWFVAGSNFVGPLGLDIPNSTGDGTLNVSNLRFGSYGAGAKPIINVSSGVDAPCNIGNPTNNFKDDIVIQNIKFTNSGTSTSLAIVVDSNGGTVSGTMSNIYFDGCDFVNTLHLTQLACVSLTGVDLTNPTTLKYGFWKCSYVSPIYTTATSASAAGTDAVITTGTTIRLTNAPGPSFTPLAINLAGLDTTAGPNQGTIILKSTPGGQIVYRISAVTGSGTTTPTVTLDSVPPGTLTNWEISSPRFGQAGGPIDWMFIVGCTFSGSGANGVLDHHVYPDTRDHQLYAWNTFGATGVGGYRRNYGINLNWNSLSGGLEYANYICISQNQFGDVGHASTALMHDAGQSSPFKVTFTNGQPDISYISEGTNHPPIVDGLVMFNTAGSLPTNFVPMHEYRVRSVVGSSVPYTITVSEPSTPATLISAGSPGSGIHVGLNVAFRNFVTQGNGCNDMSGDGPVQFENGVTHTFRDNRIWGAAYGRWYSPAWQTGPALGPKVYRNYFYIPPDAASVTLSSAAIELSYNHAWPAAVQVTDNIIWDDRTSIAQAVAVSWANAPANGSVIDRNQYYAPNSTNVVYDTVTAKTFGPQATAGTWQNHLLDVNGSKLSSRPAGWSNPPTTWSGFGP